MNKTLKFILIVINSIMLILAIYWYNQSGDTEPLISIFGQSAALLTLVFEKQVSKINAKKIHNESTVGIDVISGDNITASDINKSKVDIKTKK